MGYAHTNVPESIGFRNRLTVWQTTLGRLVDRAVLAAVEFEAFFDQEQLSTPAARDTSSGNPVAEGLILFHQCLLWSLRVVRLGSCFASMAGAFAESIIDTHVYARPSENTSEVVAVSATHPLAPLRLFKHDQVFISANATSQPGGGFLGFLVLGNDTVDIETACK